MRALSRSARSAAILRHAIRNRIINHVILASRFLARDMHSRRLTKTLQHTHTHTHTHTAHTHSTHTHTHTQSTQTQSTHKARAHTQSTHTHTKHTHTQSTHKAHTHSIIKKCPEYIHVHTPSIAFRHLPPISTATGYASFFRGVLRPQKPYGVLGTRDSGLGNENPGLPLCSHSS